MSPAVRTETDAGVRSVVLSRPEEYNTITPEPVSYTHLTLPTIYSV